jgi:hypothetical protein
MPDKIVWNNFKQALPGPKGEGQEARNNDVIFYIMRSLVWIATEKEKLCL